MKYHRCPGLRGPDCVNLLDCCLGIFDIFALSGIFSSYKTSESVLLRFLKYFESSPPSPPLAEFSHSFYLLSGTSPLSPESCTPNTAAKVIFFKHKYGYVTFFWVKFSKGSPLSPRYNLKFKCYPRHLCFQSFPSFLPAFSLALSLTSKLEPQSS